MKYSLALLILTMLLLSCSQPDSLRGTYKATAVHLDNSPDIVLQLKADGEGNWQTEYDTVLFKWQKKKGELWLHTMTGGVVAGRLTDEGIILELPEIGQLHFRRTQ